MVSRELYLGVLDYIDNIDIWKNKMEIFDTKDFGEIGNIIISTLLNEIDDMDYNDLKRILCQLAFYSKEEYLNSTYDDVCNLVCKKAMGLKTYPMDDYQILKRKYEKVKSKYNLFLNKVQEKINGINVLIYIDKENPQNCGELIRKQNELKSINSANRNILKDLKKIEDKYNELEDEIQIKYVYREMLLYASRKIKTYFDNSIFGKEGVELLCELRKMAMELAKDDGELNGFRYDFIDYDKSILAWDNATETVLKPFFMVKMRKFNDDVELFYMTNVDGTYWNQTDELLKICKEKSNKIMDSDAWIALQANDLDAYTIELKKYIMQYNVLAFLKEKIESMYCIQNRKEILYAIINAFETENYIVFSNLVVVQIEGLFYDMFIDSHIQERLDGNFDLFDNDNLKSKISKNDSKMGMEEAALYFKFYFNNILRNKVAHGRNCFDADELVRISYELLLDFQYVIHLLEEHSDTNEAIEYVQQTVKWLEFSFEKKDSNTHIYEKILNSLNGNVIKHQKNYIGYVDSHQELYWIFNPYYDEVYKFANVITERDKLRGYLLEENFWKYVSEYLENYEKQDIKYIKINKSFRSRVKAIQMYVAKNKKCLLPLISDIGKKLGKLQLENK